MRDRAGGASLALAVTGGDAAEAVGVGIDTLGITPGDGVVAGTCSINGALFDETRSRAIVVHYDYTVLAGTQGHRNHYKQDRMFELAIRCRRACPRARIIHSGCLRCGWRPAS